MKIGIYPGTFDPIHNGHIDVIERSAAIFDKVLVVLAVNSKKTHLFNNDERINMTKTVLSKLENVDVIFHDGLMAELAKDKGAVAFIRGLRSVTDFEYEMQIALMNRKMSDIATIFMMPHEKYSYLNSSIIREISRYGQKTNEFVPEIVSQKLKEKFSK